MDTMEYNDQIQQNMVKKLLGTFLAAIFLIIAAFFTLGGTSSVYATTIATSAPVTATSSTQDQIDTNQQQITELNQQIATYQAALTQVGADKKTLTAAINALDLQRNKIQAQVTVTQHQITITQLQIQQLGSQILDTKQTIETQQAGLEQEMRNLQKTDDKPLILQVLSSGSLAQAWSNVEATVQVQDSINAKMQALQAEEGNLAASQNASEQQKTTLGTQQQSLTAQQQSLTATVQSKKMNYSRKQMQRNQHMKNCLLQQRPSLLAFQPLPKTQEDQNFSQIKTVCDSWGCYYNQRDAAWGNNALNGTQYRLASDGCLVTAMAMVMTHYGYKDVTPVTINSNPANFATYYPAYLLITINVDGVSATRKSAAIDATLATGNPVIVGLNAYGGTHYVVLISGKGGQLHNAGSLYCKWKRY